MAKIDLTNCIFGRLKVIEQAPSIKGRTMWTCYCDPAIEGCGRYNIVNSIHLRSGNTRSCGCLAEEVKRTHGMSKTKEYKTWCHIKERCTNKSCESWNDYGGRGITVCEQWLNSFETFLEDVGYAPSKKHSIERIDNSKGYSPENCRWATQKEQARNTRRNRVLEYKGESRPLSKWAEEYSIKDNTLIHRLKLGWTIEEALETPVTESNRLIEWRGKVHNIEDWSKLLNISRHALTWRLDNGWSLDKTFTTPERCTKTELTFKGQTKSLMEWAEITGISHHTIRYRIYKIGWDVERALTESVRSCK